MTTDYDLTVSVEEIETPALPIDATYFYKDYSGNWHTAEVISAEPKGWGYAEIEYTICGRKISRNVPFTTLYDLDEYLEQQPDYGRFEADDTDYDNQKDEDAISRV